MSRWHLNQAITYMNEYSRTESRAENTLFSSAGYLESSENGPAAPSIPSNREFICTIHEVGSQEHWVVSWFDIVERKIILFDTLREHSPLDVFFGRSVQHGRRCDNAIDRLGNWLAGTRAGFEAPGPNVLAGTFPVGCHHTADWTSGIRCLDIIYNLLTRPSARASDISRARGNLGEFSEDTVRVWEERFRDIEAWDRMDPLFGRPEYGPGHWLVRGEWFTGVDEEEFDGVI